VLDENTLLISYLVQKGEEKILTFATLDLYGLTAIFNDCKKELSINYLRELLERRYIYPVEGCKINDDEYMGQDEWPTKHLTQRIFLPNEAIRPRLKTATFTKLAAEVSSDTALDVNSLLVKLGYSLVAQENDFGLPGRLSGYYSCKKNDTQLFKLLKSEQEVANITQRGIWGQCN
jgi:hypothetical protein